VVARLEKRRDAPQRGVQIDCYPIEEKKGKPMIVGLPFAADCL
jgi:hypothetical protein